MPIETHATDTYLGSEHFRLLQRAIDEGVAKREFLRTVDESRDRVAEELCDAYHDRYYARLLYLKLTNYVIGKYHFMNRHLRPVSKPVSVIVDPSNACQLQCPGCIHSSNADFTAAVDWPRTVMRASTYRGLLDDLGPFALNSVLYNYGEPLLNKELPDFLLAANGWGLSTSLSTNLSLPFNVEAFVKASPHYVILSIDGVTQETYESFRRRGKLDQVLENVRKLVEAKRRYGYAHPVLAWRILTFEHNLHEVDDTIELAREMGVDHVLVSTPFDVTRDDPNMKSAVSERAGQHDFIDPAESRRTPDRILELLERHESVDRLFEQGWFARAGDLDEPSHAESGTCRWLYFSTTLDASGRVLPCCIAPTVNKELVYARLSEEPADIFNTDKYVASRLAFADRARFEEEAAASDDEPPFCSVCPKAPELSWGSEGGGLELRDLDFRRALFREEDPFWWRLAAWQ